MLCVSPVTESRGISSKHGQIYGRCAIFRFLSLISQDGVPGDWLQSEAFFLVEGLKGPLSTQFTLLQLQTGDASFSATAQNIGSKGGGSVIALESGVIF